MNETYREMSTPEGLDEGIIFRLARRGDVPAIVRLLADDALGAAREMAEDMLPDAYMQAFERIDANPNTELLVVEAKGRTEGEVVGCLQLDILPGLSRQGMTRGQIEAVRIDARLRGRGIGRRLIEHAIDRARMLGCGMVQLTSDASRTDAHRFYAGLGFVPSHVGMKLKLD